MVTPRRLALLALAGVLVSACGNSAGQRFLVSPSGSPGGSGAGSPPASAPVTVSDFVPIAEKFVEEHRGLKFLKPVPVTLLSDADFTKKLTEKNKIDADALAKQAKELEALGLLEGHPDLLPLEKSLLGGAVVGFYDSETKDLFVRGTKITPYTREVMIHELTHAVQDQHFSIDRPELDKAKDERSEAFLGLLEGDSVTVENEYVKSMSPQDQASALLEEAKGAANIPPNIPPVLLTILVFPYTAGPPFVKAVRAAKGQAGLDAAFTTIPTTTQEILHPERFLAVDAGQSVPVPAADKTAFDDGILGEQGLDLLLERASVQGNLDSAKAKRASATWDGDRYSAWDAGDGTSCIRVVFQSRTPADAQLLKSAVQEYVSTLPKASIESSSPLTLRTCG